MMENKRVRQRSGPFRGLPLLRLLLPDRFLAHYRPARSVALVTGVAALGIYGSVVNASRWDFGRPISIYVACYFLVAQILNRLRFGHAATPPTLPVAAYFSLWGGVAK